MDHLPDGQAVTIENVIANLTESVELWLDGKNWRYFETKRNLTYLGSQSKKAINAVPIILSIISAYSMVDLFWLAFETCKNIGATEQELFNTLKRYGSKQYRNSKPEQEQRDLVQNAMVELDYDCSDYFFEIICKYPIVFTDVSSQPGIVSWLSSSSFGADQATRLGKALHDENPMLRGNAAFLLGYLQEQGVAHESSLKALLEDEHETVRENTKQALTQLGFGQERLKVHLLNATDELNLHATLDGNLNNHTLSYQLDNSVFAPYLSALNVTDKGGWQIEEERFGMIEICLGDKVTYETHWLPLLFQYRTKSYSNRVWKLLGHCGSKLMMYLCHPMAEGGAWGNHNYLFSFDVIDKFWTGYELKDGRLEPYDIDSNVLTEQTTKRSLSYGELTFGPTTLVVGKLVVLEDSSPYHLDDYSVSVKRLASLDLDATARGLKPIDAFKVSELGTKWLAGDRIYIEELPANLPGCHVVAIEGLQNLLEDNETRLGENESGKYFGSSVWVVEVGNRRFCIAKKSIRVSHTGDEKYEFRQFCDSLVVFEMPD
jgi:hypothetical protein